MSENQNQEYERRWIVQDIVPSLKALRKMDISQYYHPAYFVDNKHMRAGSLILEVPQSVPDINLGLRQRIAYESNQRTVTLTLKGKRVNGVCYEQEWQIEKPLNIPYLAALRKLRSILDQDGMTIEVDTFLSHVVPAIVEVENPPEDMCVPQWFGREITDDDRYSNVAIAMRKPDCPAYIREIV